jgi:hypothetical protein
VPRCPEDGYPMVPVGETREGQIKWGCSNPWHPRDPGPCPQCGHAEPHRSALTAGNGREARCTACAHEWVPDDAPQGEQFNQRTE